MTPLCAAAQGGVFLFLDRFFSQSAAERSRGLGAFCSIGSKIRVNFYKWMHYFSYKTPIFATFCIAVCRKTPAVRAWNLAR